MVKSNPKLDENTQGKVKPSHLYWLSRKPVFLLYFAPPIRATNTENAEKHRKIRVKNVSREIFLHQIADTSLNHLTIKKRWMDVSPIHLPYNDHEASCKDSLHNTPDQDSAIYRPIIKWITAVCTLQRSFLTKDGQSKNCPKSGRDRQRVTKRIEESPKIWISTDSLYKSW